MESLNAVLKKYSDVKVIDAVDYSQYIHVDLSPQNAVLHSLQSAEDFENYIENKLREHTAKVAYGGYNELRNLYKRSEIFNNSISEERNIHIGLDLWIRSGTTILAALDGNRGSFKELFHRDPPMLSLWRAAAWPVPQVLLRYHRRRP